MVQEVNDPPGSKFNTHTELVIIYEHVRDVDILDPNQGVEHGTVSFVGVSLWIWKERFFMYLLRDVGTGVDGRTNASWNLAWQRSERYRYR